MVKTKKKKGPKAKATFRPKIRKAIRKRGGRLDFSYIEEEHPDLKFCLMNNESSRIPQAIEDGWIPYKDENSRNYDRVVDFSKDTDQTSQKGGVVRRPVGPGREEASIEAVLMCIDKDKFAEIKQLEYDQIADKKKTLKSGALPTQEENVSGLQHYAPKLSNGERGYSEKIG